MVGQGTVIWFGEVGTMDRLDGLDIQKYGIRIQGIQR